MKLEDIKAYVIHISDRIDRGITMEKELSKFKPDFEVFEAVNNKEKPFKGISDSFKKVVQNAKDMGLEYVLVFEDDVKVLNEDSKIKFQNSIDSLPEDWDILLGGVYSIFDDRDLTEGIVNDNILKVRDFAGLHCTLIRNTAYDTILKHRPSEITIEGNKKVKHPNHIDRYIGSVSKKKGINVYVSYPFPVMQHDGFSDNTQSNTEYNTSFIGRKSHWLFQGY